MTEKRYRARSFRALTYQLSETDQVLLSSYLEDHGFRITYKRVGNTQELFYEVATKSWNIVFLAHHIDGNCKQIVSAITEAEHTACIVINSSFCVGGDIVEFLEAGADDYMSIFDLSRLSARIKKILVDARIRRERARVEQALAEARRSEAEVLQLFSLFTRYWPDVLFIKAQDGTLRFVNDRFLKIFECTSGQVIGRTDEELWPEFARTLQEHDRHVLMSGQTVVYEEVVPIPMADGLFVPHTWSVVKFRFEDGKGHYFLGGMARDVTHMKQIEDELRRGHHQLVELYRQFPDPALVCERESLRILLANEAAVEIFGLDYEQLRGLRLYDLSPSPVQDSLAAYHQEALAQPTSNGVIQSTRWSMYDHEAQIFEVDGRWSPLVFGDHEAFQIILQPVRGSRVLPQSGPTRERRQSETQDM